jgi:uncharacterized Zn-binding protein involved in type VI secretion
MTDDRVKGGLLGIIRALLRATDLHAHYEARIVSQNDDGTLELAPDDARIPGLSNVPIRYGLPGVSARVKPGGHVMVAFEAGDARRPVATLWNATALESIEITASDTITVRAKLIDLSPGGLPVARQGDMVACGGVTPTPCLIQLPSGPNTGAPALATITFLPLPLYGTITSGNPVVRT